jgi:hypothetical protein
MGQYKQNQALHDLWWQHKRLACYFKKEERQESNTIGINISTYLEAVQGLTHKIIIMKKIKISQETTNAMKR